MADYDRLRAQLRQARQQQDETAAALAAARERQKRIAAQEVQLARVFNPDDARYRAAREKLVRDRADAAADTKRRNDERKAAVAREAELLAQLAALTDPRDAIERLKDSIPILLMPVRLETRFKSVALPGAGAMPQLWVRIYPDDCWIDSFDPALTETEVRNATTYWAGIWQAGGFEEQERAAWAALVTSHGSGRAAWIVRQFQPTNPLAQPTKPQARDVILAIPTTTALASVEEEAICKFWSALWVAADDGEKSAAARAQLESVVGVARAAELVAQYLPVNFDSPMPAGVTRADVGVAAAIVVLPVLETKQAAWLHAPKATVLPDRFVFIGYRSDNDAAPFVQVGRQVPSMLVVAPDPSLPKEEQLQPDTEGNLIVPLELQWLSDFQRAVEVGMGLQIDLTAAAAPDGFRRVLVIGLRLDSDEMAAKSDLETLLQHHAHTQSGLAVIQQGTPTNNTEAIGSGHGRLDDPDQSFDDGKASAFAIQSASADKADGQWLAEHLGIDAGLLAHAHGAGGTDRRCARAINTALWPATLGYWMETMMAPVFSREDIESTRDFFNRFVVAGGACPALRIGAQPYGILPVTRFSSMAWLSPRGETPGMVLREDPLLPYLRRLYPILRGLGDELRGKLAELSFVGKAGDPHALLLDIVGLHPGSVEWSQRYAETLTTLFNRLNLMGFGGLISKIVLAAQRAAARGRLASLGYAGSKDPPILDLVFSGKHLALKGGGVDDKPLSETAPVRAYTVDNRNYLQWLIDACNESLDALYQQQGFIDDKPPGALLYLLLRHALQLGYHDVSVRLFENAGLYSAERAAAARQDDPFLHVRDNQNASESRYQPLYAIAQPITGDAETPVHRFIAARLATTVFAHYLREQLEALERLKDEPTARLERAFADHVDCCAYRLDAWLLGIVNYQLASMRNLRENTQAPSRQGIYLGGYAWLEEVRPESRSLAPVRLEDPELQKRFGGDPPLMRDSTNQGYVHAPSLNHAVAAAVLRNGFISNASAQNRTTMAVNITSERVRTALALLEGIRVGQSLSDLLGYQLERGLHDRHNLAEIDKFIYKLRQAFPLRANRFVSTKPPEGVSIESIEARNVVNGLALVEHIKEKNNKIYPFDKPGLPPTDTQAQADAINAEVDRLLEAHDAVADLALAEGVYQAVLGNYDRVASTYDAYARGNFPPEPDVVRTPLNGVGLTHRVALHLEAGADPAIAPHAGVPMTPRAQGEPALNRWLAAVMPTPDQVACVVAYRSAATNTDRTEQITLDLLDLQAADLVALVRDDNAQAMTELDDRIVRHVFLNLDPRPDVAVSIRYMDKTDAPFSVFELMPLVRNLRRIVTKARALQASDATLMNEASGAQDAQPFFDKARLQLVRGTMSALRGDLTGFLAAQEPLVADLAANKDDIVANVDATGAALVELLQRAARFAVPQAGWGFVYDFTRRTFAAILEQCAARVARWNDRLAEFTRKIDAEASATTDPERFDLLVQAERAISNVATSPLPPTPGQYRGDLLNVKQPPFVAKRDQLDAVRSTTLREVSALLAHVDGLGPFTSLDFLEFSLAAFVDDCVRFVQDGVSVVTVVAAELDRRLQASQALFDEHDGAATAVARVRALEGAARALLGEDFRIIPDFALSTEQGDELGNALAASRAKTLFEYLTNPPEAERDPLDFPVDHWLYGVARVRERMHAWEQVVMFSGALGASEPDLDAMQLPFMADDRWLALEFPPAKALDTDRLLYTAHFAAPFDKTKRQCGLLIDEWTETIPAATADTGITFHYDRPNSEAPQAMLLITPSAFRGTWRWDDLVAAVYETLDLAKQRAIEPKHIDESPYAPFVPATVVASQVRQLTIAAELALNNNLVLAKA